MSIFDRVSAAWTAATLPSVPMPKGGKGALAEPAHRTIVGGTTARLRQVDRGLLTADRLGVRNSKDTFDAVRTLSYSSPDLSASIYATLRAGIPEEYTVIARDMDGLINPEATALAHELLRRLTYLGNPDGTYNAQLSVQSLSESLGKQLLCYGAMAGEVALDKGRVPSSLNPISVTTLKWYDEDKSVRPVQVMGGVEIELDSPTFIYVALDQDLLDAYSGSPLEASVQPILTDLDFNNDVRRALKRAIIPRLMATIDSELVKKFTPPDILNDGVKFTAYKQALISAVQNVVNNAAPEDALISFSEVTYSIMDAGVDPSAIIEKMQGVLNSKLQAGIKTLPVVIGHGTTSSASSAESLLFLKSANMVRVKLNEFYSKALTMAIRLMGQDMYVEFKYKKLDLRPDSELEAYKAMEQSRVLELLSLGFISDEEASIALTGNLPSKAFKPLSGTMFKSPQAPVAAQTGTAASGTSGLKGAPATPTQPKSATKAEVDTSQLDNLAAAHKAALDTVQDMAYGIAKNANRPVEVTVAPTELHLTLAQNDAKPSRTIRVVKGADGRPESFVLEETKE
jgi:hypothetical protein